MLARRGRSAAGLSIQQQVNIYDAFTACVRNSFPAQTPVLMADGSHRPISQ